jgi:hypothetical protein
MTPPWGITAHDGNRAVLLQAAAFRKDLARINQLGHHHEPAS